MREVLIGAGCAESLGDPDTIRELANVFLKSGTGLEQLVVELRQEVSGLVPGEWEGQTATNVQGHTQPEHAAAAEVAAAAQRLAQAALTLASSLDTQAWVPFAEAEAIALANNLDIGPNCWVYPRPGYNPATQAWAFERAQALVTQAQDAAYTARQIFRGELADTPAKKMTILRPLAITAAAAMMAGMGRARRSGGRGRSGWRKPQLGEIKPGSNEAYAKGLRQLIGRDAKGREWIAVWNDKGEVFLQQWEPNANGVKVITKEGMIGKVDLPTGIPPTGTDYGNAMESRTLDLLERETGIQFQRFGPGYTGPDIVPK